MWNERYSVPEYIFGKQPANFLKNYQHLLKPGMHALALADGEGRNAVFLARQGLTVTAMDSSTVGISKARQLAVEADVSVDFHIADIQNWDWQAQQYDVVVAVFIQFFSFDASRAIFEGIKQTLKPGGLLLLHGYRPEQLAYGTGGPPDVENMYTEGLLTDVFQDMEILTLNSYDTELDEGLAHAGMSALIDLIARKR